MRADIAFLSRAEPNQYPGRSTTVLLEDRRAMPIVCLRVPGGVVTMASVERLKDGRYTALFHDDGRFLRNAGKPDKFRVPSWTRFELWWSALRPQFG